MVTEKLNTANNFIKTNVKWIVGIVFFIIMLYLNSIYESKQTADKSRIRIDKLETENLLYKQRLNTLERRFETKLKVLNKTTDRTFENKNKNIELETILKTK